MAGDQARRRINRRRIGHPRRQLTAVRGPTGGPRSSYDGGPVTLVSVPGDSLAPNAHERYVDGVQPVLRLPEGHRTGGSTSKACARGCCPRTTCRGCGTSRPGRSSARQAARSGPPGRVPARAGDVADSAGAPRALPGQAADDASGEPCTGWSRVRRGAADRGERAPTSTSPRTCSRMRSAAMRMRRGAHVSLVLARERTAVAEEANPRAISQMPNVSSNNPPGMAPTSPAPATPNSSSSVPTAKHA